MESNPLIARSQIASYLLACVLIVSLSTNCKAQDRARSVGTAPYSKPQPSHIRILFGYGGNAGLGGYTPSSFVGDASYRSGGEWIVGFVSSTSVTNDLPRRTYSEFDVMYGISFDEMLAYYEGPSDGMHTSLSAGVSFDAYQERWRPYGRRSLQNVSYPATTFRYSLGVPVQFQAVYEPFRYAGIGILLFYNASAFSPSYGGAIVLEVRY